jgi:SAM-dependent methyltransferase
MDLGDGVPQQIDISRPNPARMYDCFLGGSHNFAVDRTAAEQAIEVWPELPTVLRANRSFLRRAVQHLVAAGIDQFVDLGSGIPTVGNVHEVARQLNPATRVVYVDIDPVAVAHSRTILTDDPNATVIHADLRDPQRILADPALTALVDLTKPVAVLMVAVLHFVPDNDDPRAIVSTYFDAVAPGSHLVLSHATHEVRPERRAAFERLYAQTTNPLYMRSRAEITAMFDRFTPIEPGVVYLPQWRPDAPEAFSAHPEDSSGIGGVGHRS